MNTKPQSGQIQSHEIEQIGDLKSQGIADRTVGLGYVTEYFLRNGNIVAVILRANPQPQNIRSRAADEEVRGIGFGFPRFLFSLFLAFADFVAILVNNKTMSNDLFVRGPPFYHHSRPK